MITRRQLLEAAAAGTLLPLAARPARAATYDSTPGATLGAIRAVTITAPRLDEVEAAWTRYLEYRLIHKGQVPAATAQSWGAPALAGKGIVILGPASGEPTCIRFVEQETPADFDVAATFGWRMTEMTVQNSDELYLRLKDSPFKLRGPPAMVPTYSYLKALIANGPAGEQLAFTWITERRPDLAVAESFVGRCFLAQQTVPDLPASLEFFRSNFGNESSPIRQLPSTSLSLVKLNEGAKIEFHQHRPGGRMRERVPGGLPPGLALVTFECTGFDRMAARFISPAAPNAIEPFTGRRAGTMTGPVGELIELLDMS